MPTTTPRPFEPLRNGNLSRRRIGHQTRHGKGMDPRFTLGKNRPIGGFGGHMPAPGGADDDPGAKAFLGRQDQAGHGNGLSRRLQGHEGGAVAQVQDLRWEIRGPALNPRCDLDGKPVQIGQVQRSDRAMPGAKPRIGLGQVLAKGVHRCGWTDRARPSDGRGLLFPSHRRNGRS